MKCNLSLEIIRLQLILEIMRAQLLKYTICN